MPIERSFERRVGRSVVTNKYRLKSALVGLLGLLTVAACVSRPDTVASAPQPALTPLSPALPFDQAVLKAANAVLSSAPPPSVDGLARQLVVIDPLVNGVTGEQSTATTAIAARIVDLARQSYPQFDIEPFTPQAISRSPYIMIGTFTPVDAQNRTAGDRDAYRFCLVMADLRSGKIVAKSVVRVQLEGVDPTPTAFFRDSPIWTGDAQVKGYINTCQTTKIGDPISPVYLDGILAASIISQAVDAYDSGHYAEAEALYTDARATRAGHQLRVFNGLYLANLKLGRQEAAAAAFGEAVDYSLSNDRLGVKFLFRPASTSLETDAGGPPYGIWLQQIATRAAAKHICLQATGNTSKSGSPALNDRLSLLRAEYIKERLEEDDPALNGHVTANGAGSSANLIGTGADNESDALDRRVEFTIIPAC
jgi:outer membrane protein OmpA-like peptidoglycan-associated protein